MDNLLKKLESGQILLGDGAMGTSLQSRGLEPGQCPESWNVEHADQVAQIIAGYVEAGSDIVETNSFGGTRYKLGHYGLAEQAADINRIAAQLARQAAGTDCFVAGSVGPTGELLKPLGPAEPDEIYAAFKEQVVALADGGADAICIETMMAMEEALEAIKAARENTDLPVIATFTFDKTRKGEYRTLMGMTCAQVAEQLTSAGVDIIGSNCGGGIDQLVEICKEMAQHTDKFIMIQPNAGIPEIVDGQTVFKASAQDMAAKVDQLIENGANIIGGCCGTTPEHIKAFRKVLDNR